MNTILKRIVALVLCLVMTAGYIPVNAFADETGETVAAAAAEATTEPSVVETAEETAAETTEETDPEKPGKFAAFKSSYQETPPVAAAIVPETSEETEPAVIAVTGITLDQTALEVAVGAVDVALTAAVQPEDATDKTVTWTSSEPGVASVDENGALTIGYMGEATITATAGEFSATCTVTVGEGEAVVYADNTVDYLMLGSDRHGISTVIGALLGKMEAVIGDNEIDYVGLLGDMVDDTKSYDTDTILKEVTGTATNLTAENVDIVYAAHDKGTITDGNSMLNKESGCWYTDDDFYIYGVIEDDVKTPSNASTAASAFTSWVNGLNATDDRVIVVISHFPLHTYRGDNNGAGYWHKALNKAATGAESGDSTVERNVLFFHGHNHTKDSTEYHYSVGSTMSIENLNSTSTSEATNGTDDTIYYTYATAGYMLSTSNRGGNGHATLLTITDSTIGLSRYDYSTGLVTSSNEYAYSADGTAYVTRVANTPAVTLEKLTVTGENEYTVGDNLELTVTAAYSNGTTADVTADATLTGYDMNTAGTYTVKAEYAGKTAEYAITVTESESGDNAGGSTEPEEENSNEVTLGGGTTTTYNYTATATTDGATGYILVSNGYALQNNNGTMDAVAVTVSNDESTITFDSAVDVSSLLWTIDSNGKMMNGNYYFLRTNGSGSYITYISTNCASDAKFYSWSYSGTTLTCTSSSATYYAYYNTSKNAFWTSQNTSQPLKFYVPTGGSTEVTYTIRAENLKQVVSDTSKTGKIDFCLQGNGSDLTTLPSGGSYSFTEVADTDNIIASIGNDGTVNFTGTTGTATVKVAYTWTQDGETHTVYKKITVETTAPYYELNLHKANSNVEEVTGLNAWVDGTAYYTQNEDGTYTKVDTTTLPDSTVTYYAVTYTVGDEITDVISIKGIEAGDQYGVWAVVKSYDGTTEDGTDMGSVANDIEWSSSDESVATVDPISGIITFTGKDGTVNITATYKNGNKPSDTITISATASQYSVPADGTTDFPEYPNEGAIRFDKTATAVGNFSETGIAQLELSMTGVPYTTGSEIDVVLMLDITGSMHDVTSSSYTYSKYTRVEATIIAAMEFVKSIVVNEDGTYNNNRVGIYSFNSKGTYTLWELGKVTNLNTVNSAIQTFNNNYASGGTPYDDGLSKVQSVLNTAKTDGTGNNRQQFAIFMTDGVPTDYEYINGTSHANYSSASSIAGMLTSSDNYCTRDTDYKYEYYSTEMKKAGVTVYSVGIGLNNKNSAWESGSATQCLNLASRLLNDISGPANETTQPDAVGTSTLSKMYTGTDFSNIKGKYFFSVDDSNADDMSKVFTAIALEVRQAATDVTVEDKITDEYTMIFDIPEGTEDITGVTNDFYIEFGKYALNADHERTTFTSVTKLYLKNTNGTLSAKDSTAPVFEQKTIGDKGKLFYWTTDASYASKAAVSYPTENPTHYFIPYGMKANADGTAPANWYNMTSGAYAYGTVDDTNMSQNLVIATPYFVYNADTKMIYWTVDKLDTEEYVLKYFLYLDNSATEVGTGKEVDPGSYPTNDHAYITYTNFKGNDCQQKFPEPQLTWSGAQVSYVFYLVNAAGQPINKSGQVVDFANATFVTDVYTEDTVWNKGADGQITADSQLSIDWLAANLLPSDYKVYDEAAKYQLHVFGSHTGESIFDYFTISGGTADAISASLNNRLVNVNTTASTVSLTTTKVYNTKAGEKITGYGTYTSKATDEYNNETVLNGFDFYNTTVAFAVVWQPALAPDTIVVDYGLDVLINVTFNDLMQDNTISGIGLSRDDYGSIAENTGISTTSVLGKENKTTKDGSTISIEPNEVQIRFSQNDMTFEKPVTFYYESAVKYYENSNQKDGYLHSSVTVIPATTIYYEDEFVTLTSDTKVDGTWTQDETAAWTTEGPTTTATQAQDRPGTTQITGVIDANNNYGYDAAYSSMSEYSMGSAAKANVYNGHRAKASFEFYGTGFDVISLTSNKTGTIVVSAYPWDASTNAYSTDAAQSYVVDTYYGYTRNTDGEWVVDTNDSDNALYQVPVMKISGLTYGKYKAEIVAAYNTMFDHEQYADDSYDFYLDAIRIYDPANNGADNQVIEDAYKADGEGWPTYNEVRNKIIEADTFESVATEAVNGIVFIDGVHNNASVSDYTSYGPNNETYLAGGQAIAFNLNATAESGDVAKVQLAVKTVGGSASVKVYSTDGVTALDKEITTATDMYYDITAMNGKTVVIMNDGEEGILSITNVKVTYTEEQPATENPAGVFTLRRTSVETVLASLNEKEEVPETTEPSVPETTEPEETKPVKPDNSELKAAVEEARKIKQKGHSQASFKKLQTAIKAAEKVLKDKKATQAQIDKALADLNAAVDAMETVEVKPIAPKPGTSGGKFENNFKALDSIMNAFRNLLKGIKN